MARKAPHLQTGPVLLLLCIWWSLASLAVGQEIRVVVVEPAGGDPMADRLAYELNTVGLDPVSVVRPPPVEGDEVPALDVLRGEAEASAAFETSSTESTVWLVIGREDQEPIRRSLTWDGDDPTAEALVGVQAVEMLRAELLAEVAISERRASRLSLSQLARLFEGPPGTRIGLWVGTELVAGTVEGGPQSRAVLGLRVPVTDRLRTSLDLQFVGGRTVFGADPRTRVFLGQTEASLGLGLLLTEPDAAWQPEVGAALGLAWRTVGADPEPLWRVLGPLERSTLGPLVGLRSAITTPRVGPVGGRGELQLDLERPQEVRVEGEPVGRWGPATLGFGIAADVVF